MADRYWVGGTASWDGTAGTKWATASGAGGGASVPTTDDDVFFTNLSTGTCTIAAGNTGAKSINCTGFTGTITGSAAISVAGSITLAAGQTYSHSGIVTLTGTGTLTTAGKTFSNLTVDGVGITVTLGDALNISSRILTVTNGTFTTSASNYNVTAGSLPSSNSNTRTITLGSSTLSLSGSSPINFSTSTNLTFNANTSQINLTGSSGTLLGGGQTFYNVSFTSASAGTRSITGVNTFNNLTLNASATGLSILSLPANQTVNGTFTCAGTSGIQRGFVLSDTFGTTRTITANAISANNCDFRDITIAGTAAGASPTRAGDCGGNSGITFPAAKTVYWNPATAASLASASWATSSGDTTLSSDNFPLAQDTAVFDNSSRAGVSTNPSGATWNIGTINMSNRTTAFTLNLGNSGFTVYNNWSSGTGVTIAANVTITFSGRNTTQTITSNGVAFAGSITVDNVNSTVQLADAISLPQTFTLTRGTLDLANLTLTCGLFSSNNSNTREIQFGTGNITTTGSGTVWTTATATNLTYTGTPTVNISNNSATATTVSPHSTAGDTEANVFDFNFTTGSYALTLTNPNIRNLAFTGGTISWSIGSNSCTFYGSVTLLAGMTYTAGVNAWNFAATSGVQTITSAGKTLGSIRQNGVGGTFQVQSGMTLATTATYTLNAGTLDLGTNTATLSTGLFSSSNSNTRVIAFGTGNITTTGSGNVWTTGTATNLTYTGTPTVNISNNSATATTVSAHQTGGTEANAFDYNFTTGSYTLSLSSGSVIRNLAFTGGTITWSPGSSNYTFYGSVTLLAGMTYTAGSGTWTFAATSGVQTITHASKTLGSITQNGVGGTVRLPSGTTTLDVARTYTLTNGTLDLGTNTATLSCGLFSSNNSNTREIQFGTGNITTTGSGNVWLTGTATNLTYTGTPTVNISNNSATATTVQAHTTGGTATNTFDFNFTTGSYTLSLSNSSRIRNLAFTGGTITWSPSSSTCTFYGNLTLLAGMTFTAGSGAWTFAATSGTQTITSAGKTLGPITINNTGTSVQLVGTTTAAALVFAQGTLDINSVTTSFTTLTCATGPSSIINGTLNLSSTVTHTSGTFTLGTSGILTTASSYALTAGSIVLGSNTLTTAIFSSSNSNVRSIDFGTGQITLTGSSLTIWDTSTATNFTWSGTAKIVSNYSGTLPRTFEFGSLTVPFTVGSGSGNQVSFGTAGTGAVVARGSMASLDFTGFTGTWAQGSLPISITSGNLTLVSGMTTTDSSGTISFTATSGTQVITSAGKTMNPITINGVGGTVQLADNTSTNGVTTLTSGTLNLGNNTLSTRTFFAGDLTAAIQFGTGNITVNSTAGGTVWNTSDASELTHTGTPTVNISCNTSTATGISIYSYGTAPAENRVFDFNFTTGTYVLTTDDGFGGFDGYVGSFNFTGFTGTYVLPSEVYFYRNLTLAPGMTFTHSNKELNFIATSGTQTITSAGKTLYHVNKSGVGGTLSLADNLTLDRRLDLISGTFNANNQNVTVSGFVSNYSNTRTLTMGSGTWTLTNSGVLIWNLATTTGLTFNKDTANIVLSDTSSFSRKFNGGGLTYNNLTIGGATGTSILRLTGNNTFNTLASTKTVAHTISFEAGTTTTVANWTITGTAGNVVTLNSETPGSQATLTKTGGGVINGIDYLSIQDLNATPESTWYAGANSTNVSNNTGWVFPAPSNGNFFMLF